MIDIHFKYLFTIELLHKFFADQVCNNFSFTPSGLTTNIINGQRLIVKQYQNKLFAGIQTQTIKPVQPGNTYMPFSSLENGLQMTFYMSLNNPFFFNYTNLSDAFDAGKIFYFTNRNNNLVNTLDFLSAKIAAYDNLGTYLAGDMATDPAGIVYRAILASNSVNQHSLADNGYWMKVDANRYVSGNDILQWLPSLSTYSFGVTPQSTATISVSGYDSNTGNYTVNQLTQSIAFGSPAYSFSLDLSALAPGKYSLTVNGAQQWIYINDELSNRRPFAVIDIFNEVTPASCNLVDGSGNLLSPVYTIYFLNRATIWKYVLASGKTGNITDTTGTYSFITNNNLVTSMTPIPLMDIPLSFNLSMNNNTYTKIPCPNPFQLVKMMPPGDNLCSEIYLNY